MGQTQSYDGNITIIPEEGGGDITITSGGGNFSVTSGRVVTSSSTTIVPTSTSAVKFTNGTTSIEFEKGKILLNGREISDSFEGEIKMETKYPTKIDISVTGGAQSVSTTSGNIKVDKTTHAKTVSGYVNVSGAIDGNVSTVSGDVSCKSRIGGNVSTISGDVKMQ